MEVKNSDKEKRDFKYASLEVRHSYSKTLIWPVFPCSLDIKGNIGNYIILTP